MWELFKEYLTTVLRRWYVLAVTVSLALLGLVREVASSFWDINFTVPAWLWVSVFVVTFAVANFHTFLDVRKEPRLSFSLLSPIPTGNKRGGEIVRIKIENPNGPDIQNCQVNLESLTKHDGTDVDQHLPVAICTKIQTGKLRGTSSSFNLSWGLSQQLYFAWNPKKIACLSA